MKNSLFLFVLLLLCTLVGFSPIVTDAGSDSPMRTGKVDVKGKVWKYDTLCNFENPKNLASGISYSQGHYESTGCEDLEAKIGHPQAICISYTNLSDSDFEIPIDGLSNVILTTKDGKKLQAIAFQTYSPLVGSGYIFNFTTVRTNTITFTVKPGEKADLIFLFPKANTGDTVKIGKLSPITIRQNGSVSKNNPALKTVKGLLHDINTQKAVVGARVILAPKQVKEPACVIDTKLTAVTDSAGRFSIDDVPPGEYVVFYNLSGKVKTEWNGLKVDYSPVMTDALALPPGFLGNIQKSLDVPVTVLKGSKIELIDNNLVIDGFLYAKDIDLLMIAVKGKLLTTTINKGAKEINLSVRTDILQ